MGLGVSKEGGKAKGHADCGGCDGEVTERRALDKSESVALSASACGCGCEGVTPSKLTFGQGECAQPKEPMRQMTMTRTKKTREDDGHGRGVWLVVLMILLQLCGEESLSCICREHDVRNGVNKAKRGSDELPRGWRHGGGAEQTALRVRGIVGRFVARHDRGGDDGGHGGLRCCFHCCH